MQKNHDEQQVEIENDTPFENAKALNENTR